MNQTWEWLDLMRTENHRRRRADLLDAACAARAGQATADGFKQFVNSLKSEVKG